MLQFNNTLTNALYYNIKFLQLDTRTPAYFGSFLWFILREYINICKKKSKSFFKDFNTILTNFIHL